MGTINELLVLFSHNINRSKHRGLAIDAAKTKQERLYRLGQLLRVLESEPEAWRYRKPEIPWALIRAHELLGL